jgi:hypothetical protein
MENNINFILKNLEFPDPFGRKSVLEILQTIFDRFPQQVVTHFGEIAFFSLIVNLVKEENQEIKTL